MFSQAVNNKNNITASCLSVEVAVEVAGMMLFFFEMKWLQNKSDVEMSTYRPGKGGETLKNLQNWAKVGGKKNWQKE